MMRRRTREEAASLRGLNGWLTIFAIDVVLSPLVWAWAIVQSLRAHEVLLTAAGVYVAVLFFRKDRRFPVMWIVVEWVALVYHYDGVAFWADLATAIIFTAYLLRSKRVANTFVTGVRATSRSGENSTSRGARE